MSWKLPLVLLLLPAVLPFCLRRRKRIRNSAPGWPPAQFSSGSRIYSLSLGLEQLLLGIMLLLAVLMAAGPYVGHELRMVSRKGIDVALVLDISASMQAADFQPSRLEALKKVAVDFVRRAGSHRIAVYAFAGKVFTQTPLTTDLQSLEELIGSLAYESVNHAESGGTAIGDAILLVTDDLEKHRIRGREQLLILIGDGQSNSGMDPILAARHLRESGIRLEVIGIGGKDEVEVLIHGKPFINTNNEVLKTMLDDTQLREIARAGGGRYQRALDGEVLQTIFDSIAGMTATPLRQHRTVIEKSLVGPLAILFLLLLFCWAGLNLLLLRRPLK